MLREKFKILFVVCSAALVVVSCKNGPQIPILTPSHEREQFEGVDEKEQELIILFSDPKADGLTCTTQQGLQNLIDYCKLRRKGR